MDNDYMRNTQFTIRNGFKFGLGLSLAWVVIDGLNKSKRINEDLKKLQEKVNTQLDAASKKVNEATKQDPIAN